jgi:hypothetical protein
LVDIIDGNSICSGQYDWLMLLMATVYVQVIMIAWLILLMATVYVQVIMIG